MDHIKLRDAGESDKALLFDLHERLFRSHIDEIWGWDTVQQVEIFEREWTTSRVRVIEIDGILAGSIQQREQDDHTCILSLGLDTPFQSRGLGSQLIDILKNEAVAEDKALHLNVFRTNPRAQDFYQRHGFRIAKHGENGCTLVWGPFSKP